MIESNNPEINVDELMQKIHEKLGKRQGFSQAVDTSTNVNIMMSTIIYIEALLKNAESRAYARTKWPDKLNQFYFNFHPKIQKFILKFINFLFKDQREVNFNLIFSLKESVALNRQLIEQITTLRVQMDERLSTVDSYFQTLDKRLSTVDSHFQTLDEQLSTVNSHFQTLDERLSTVDSHFQTLDERLSTVNSHFQTLDEQLSTVDSHFQTLDERLDVMDSSFQGMDDSFNTIDGLISNWLTSIQERLDTVNTKIQTMDEYLSGVDNRIQKLDERYIENHSYLRNDLMQQKRLITMFLEEARKRLPETFTQEQLHSFVKEEQYFLDAFYVAFEDQFRGSRGDIFNRLKVYLPLIEEAKIGTPDTPILDVGCGRGEWLELLRDSGYTANGLDINKLMIEQCKARGLEVIEGDVIGYLQSLPDGSLGAVTGFHIIEHLKFDVLIKLFNETMRVLKTGGLAIFETPNPDNVLVGSNTFYTDPTHRNPLPNAMIKFLAESCGFSQVTCMKLHPYAAQYRLTGSEVAERFSDYFYGPQDYAVIGLKP